MKEYVVYYEDYISIARGEYNVKNNHYTIKSLKTIHKDKEYANKYDFLEEVLKSYKFKSKEIVLTLSTKDLIIKSTTIPKVNPEELEGLMKNEIHEIMSLDAYEYIFSYEVTNEILRNDLEMLEVIIVAIKKNEIQLINDIFKSLKLRIERIDTMSTALIRLLKNEDYESLMLLDIGSYGSLVNILKDNSLVIYDNIPVKVTKEINDSKCNELLEEVRGLRNYYSSRNFGKSIDYIVLIGEAFNNKKVNESLLQKYNNKFFIGINSLFDFKKQISGKYNEESLGQVPGILGSMHVHANFEKYSIINLNNIESKKKKGFIDDNFINYFKLAGVAFGIILITYVIACKMVINLNKEIEIKNSKLDNILIEAKKVNDLNDKVNDAKSELAIYNSLKNSNLKLNELVSDIGKCLEEGIDINLIKAYYEGENEDKSNENDCNTIQLEGKTNDVTAIGSFVHKLNLSNYFKNIEHKTINEEKDSTNYSFVILLELKEGFTTNEEK